MDAAQIALCQVNIAIGFVYIGLREFRYRESLSDSVWSSFFASGCDDMDPSSVQYSALTRDDRKFVRCHEYITGWASWLILDRLPKNWKDALSGGSARSNLRWYNRLFTTYNDGWDKRVVFVCLILGPIAMLWAGVSAGWPLAAGQGLVVVQTLAAWGTARLAGRGINKRGGYMKSKLVAAAAEQQEDKVSTPTEKPAGTPPRPPPADQSPDPIVTRKRPRPIKIIRSSTRNS